MSYVPGMGEDPALVGLAQGGMPMGMGFGGGIPIDPGSMPAYGPGPAPIGAPVGTDDYSQEAFGLPPGIGGVAGDAIDEEEFELPDAIDTERIPDAKKLEWLRDLGTEMSNLIDDGRAARETGGRDYWLAKWRTTYEGGDHPTKGPWPGSSRIIPPDMRAAIESINARDMEALFASRERVRIKTRKETDNIDGGKLVRHIDDFFHSPEIDLRGRLTRACLTARVDATIICDTFWRREKQKRRRRVRIDNNILAEFAGPKTTPGPIGNPADFPAVRINGKEYKFDQIVTLEQEVVTRNHFDFQFIPVQDFFMYPANSPTIENAIIAGYDFWQTENDIRVCAANGQYDQKAVDRMFGDENKQTLLSVMEGHTAIAEDEDPMLVNGVGSSLVGSMGVESSGENTGKYGRYRMRKYWARVRDVNKDKLHEDLLIIQNHATKEIVFCQADPYDNLGRSLKHIDIDPRIGGGFYPYSMVEKSLDAHIELQAIARLGIDLAVLASTIIVPVDPAARRGAEPIVFKPGPQYWKTDVQGTLGQPIAFPMVQNQYIPQRDMLSRYVEKITGASEILTGATPDTGTATEANIQVASSGIRSKTMLLNIVNFLTWLYNQYRDYTTQFIEETEGESFRVSLGPGRGFEDIDLQRLSIEGAITAYCEAIDPDVALALQMAEKELTLLSGSPFVQSDLGRLWQVMYDYIQKTNRSFVPGPRMGTLEEAMALQQKTAQAEEQAQAGKLKLPEIPPNASLEYLAAVGAENREWLRNFVPALQMVSEADASGRLREATTKIAGQALTTSLAPPKPDPQRAGTGGGRKR